MDYKFSLVIPAYNAEKYVSCMIESILNQTYHNWELIIVDDGSTDRTGEICDKYGVDKRITVYHNENQGQMCARIFGINQCLGDYILVVDADDYLKEGCLEHVNKIINSYEYDCVFFLYEHCDDKLRYTKRIDAPRKMGVLSPEEVIEWVVDTWNHVLYNKVFKSECIKNGAAESITERVYINGDYALVIPILCQIRNAYYIDKSFYKYRVHDNSISHRAKFQHVLDTDYVTESVVRILQKYSFFSGYIGMLVMRAYLNMISEMVSKVVLERDITCSEIEELHNREFFQKSKIYEKKQLIGIISKVEMVLIRNKLKGHLFFMNKGIRCINRVLSLIGV